MTQTTLDKLTAQELQVCTGSSLVKAQEWLPFIQMVLKAFNITSKKRVAAFLAQIGHESAGLKALEENLNYSATGLANTWPNRYAQRNSKGAYVKSPDGKFVPNSLGVKLSRKPQAIANNCYANRMGNGNEASGDGWKYRGRGLKQLTGKSNYAKLTLETGIDFVTDPDKLLDPGYALISACWFWDDNNLSPIADRGDFELLTRKINGGLIGYKQRLALYEKAMKILKD